MMPHGEQEGMRWERRGRLRALARDVAVILLGIMLVLGLFVLQSFLEGAREEVQGTVLTGAQIIINTTSTNPPPREPGVVITPQYPQVQHHPRVQCLMQGGLTEDDVHLAGELLEGVPCPERQKREVKAALVDKCLRISVGGELDTALCVEKEGAVSLDFAIPSVAPGQPPAVAVQRSFNGIILFVLFLMTVLWVWREYEMRERKLEERQKERQRYEYHPVEEVEVKIIKSAPLFKEAVSEEERYLSPEEVREIHAALLREQQKMGEAPPLQREEIGEYIKGFNELGKEISRYLREGKLHKARRRYLLLFPLYTRLYYAVDEERKGELVDVMKYLHDQLNIMEKSKKIRHLIEEVYRDVEKHRVDVEPEHEKIVVLRDEKEKAEGVFSSLSGEGGPVRKKEVIRQIEKVQEHLERKDVPREQRATVKDLQAELEELKELVYHHEKEQRRGKLGKQKA